MAQKLRCTRTLSQLNLGFGGLRSAAGGGLESSELRWEVDRRVEGRILLL